MKAQATIAARIFGPVAASLLRVQGELTWVAGGQVLAVLGTAFGIKLLTNALGPQGYGILALTLTVAGIANQLLYGPLSQSVMRFYSLSDNRAELGAFFKVVRSAHVLGGVVFLGLGAIAAAVVASSTESKWSAAVVLTAVFAVISGFNASLYGLQIARRKHGTVAVHQAVDAWLRPTLAYVAIYLLATNAGSALVGYVTAGLVVTLSLLLLARALAATDERGVVRKVEARIDPLRREMLNYAAPFVAFGAAGLGALYADKWILQYFGGVEKVGIYAAMLQIAYLPMTVLANVVVQLLLPIVYRMVGDLSSRTGLEEAGRAHYLAILGVSASVAAWVLFLFLFAEPVLRLFTAPEFVVYHHLLWILALAAGLFQIGQVMIVKGMYGLRPRIYVPAKALHAASVLVLGWLLTSWRGLEGLVWAMGISSALYLAAVLYSHTRAGFAMHSQARKDAAS